MHHEAAVSSEVSATTRCAGLRRYGWLRHDGRTFGEQELLDGGLNITTSFVSGA